MLTDDNEVLCRKQGWNGALARCERFLGQFALADEDLDDAGRYLSAATARLRDAGYLPDLAETLPALAEYASAAGDPAAAGEYLTEAIAIAAPRNLVPAHCAALATRARLRGAQGRPDADAALGLATSHDLPWSELDALRAHAALDEAGAVDHGWAARAGALHTRLVPPGLDRDPLGTVERAAAQGPAA